jgi:type II secretory pathway pseudopilin PulG
MADNGAGKPDVDDISLDDRAPRKKSGGGAFLAIVVVIIIVGIALAAWSVNKKNKEAEEKAKQQARETIAASLTEVKSTVQQAVDAATAGDLDIATAKLDAADAKLSLIISSANANGDQDVAKNALNQAGAVKLARKAIGDARAALQTAIDEQLGTLRTTFGLSASPTATPPATEGGETPPATPEGATTTTVPNATTQDQGSAAPSSAAPAPPGTATAPAAPAAPAAPGPAPSGAAAPAPSAS